MRSPTTRQHLHYGMFSLEVTGSGSGSGVSPFDPHVLKSERCCCCAQNGNTENPYCNGMEGILEAYHQSLKTVQLYGPTNFSPVVNHVARYEHKCPSLRRGAPSLRDSQSAEGLQRGDAPVRDIKAAGDDVSVSGAELTRRKKLSGCFCEANGQESTAPLAWSGEVGSRDKQSLHWKQCDLFSKMTPRLKKLQQLVFCGFN